jgi:hypothetical protein
VVQGLALVGVFCCVIIFTILLDNPSPYTFTWLWIALHSFLNLKALSTILAFNAPQNESSHARSSSKKNVNNGGDATNSSAAAGGSARALPMVRHGGASEVTDTSDNGSNV